MNGWREGVGVRAKKGGRRKRMAGAREEEKRIGEGGMERRVFLVTQSLHLHQVGQDSSPG